MQKRKSISLKNRFRVFKRDDFKCQYCGKGLPEVILEVDHITPVSKGGDNTMNNLITSCFDCNRGKSDELLTIKPKNIQDTIIEEIELKKERQKQIKYFDKELRKLKKEEKATLDDIGIYWWDNFVKVNDRGYTVFAGKRLVSIKTFLKKLTPEEIKSSMDIALDRLANENQAWKYFCGVCWCKIKERE